MVQDYPISRRILKRVMVNSFKLLKVSKTGIFDPSLTTVFDPPG